MLVNLQYILPSAIIAMMESEFDFYLTGSWFFGQSNGNSDYDFFALDTPEIREFLFEHGFGITDKKYKGDNNATAIFVKYGDFASGIDVQLYSSRGFECKKYAQNLLKKAYPCGLPTDERVAEACWYTAYAAFDAVNDEIVD